MKPDSLSTRQVRLQYRIPIRINRTTLKPDSSPIANAGQKASDTVSIYPRALAPRLSSSSLAPKSASRQFFVQNGPLPIDYTNNIKLTGNKTIDAVLAAGNYWWNSGAGADGSNPSASADHTVTFSFLTNTAELSAATVDRDSVGFQGFSESQKNVIREAFAYISTVANITFSEVESSGQIQLGSNNQGGGSAGYAYYPNAGGAAGPGGTVLIANDQTAFSEADSWNKGGYLWEVVLHEIGHALGLKHPGNYNAGGGGTPGPYLSKSSDTRTNTIMSYNDDLKKMHSVENNGSGAFTAANINPDSFQAMDITALQYLYGAVTTAGPTTYTFADDEKFSRTIYDTNSGSAIDLTGMNQNSVIDLRGGHFSSIGLRDAFKDTGLTKDQYLAATSGGLKLSKLLGTPTYTGTDNLTMAMGSKIQTATGGNGNDFLISGSEIGGPAHLNGGAGDDSYFIASGDAVINDASGLNDTVFVLKKSGAVWTINEGRTKLTQTNTKTGVPMATVDISGIEHVGYWNGKTQKGSGNPLFSPVEKKKIAAYSAIGALRLTQKLTIKV